MADPHPTLEEIRLRLIQLLNDSNWEMTETAERDGRYVLRRHLPIVTQCSIVDFIVAWLTKPDCRMHSILMGEPPGSNGIGYVVRHDEDPLIYIKLKIEDEIAWVISFHDSVFG